MWSRYGTPTKRAGSGTEEEFKRAKARFDADSESVHLMMYFKTAPVSIREIDTKQIDAIENFRRSLGSQGGLWWEFGDPDEFEKLIRLHLTRQVQAWKQKSGKNLPTPSQSTTASVESSPSDGPDLEQSEMGILDLIEIYEDRVAQLTGQLNQSKRRVVSVLDRFLGEMVKGENLVHEAEISIGKANRKGDDR